MECNQCGKNLVDCDCPDIEEHLKKLDGSKFLDPMMLIDIRKKRKKRKLKQQLDEGLQS